ncbi:MAG: winged helix-turn-helix transcriptional regulator [Nitrosarchaeum sp.]|nr:winged helix-turn-helix transcriptional regulator [Nitrosarchaeum sp.]
MSNAVEKRKKILKIIIENPGAGFLDIQKNTGYGHGNLSHHLKTLEQEGSIRIRREKRKVWVFDSASDPNYDRFWMFLRKETCKKILIFLLEERFASFAHIRDAIKKSPGTTSTTIKTLMEKKLIKKIPGFPDIYTLEDYEKTKKIIDRMNVSQTDELKDRFVDTFSYY